MKTDEDLIWEMYLLNEMPYNHGTSTNGKYENRERNYIETKSTIDVSDHIGKFYDYDIYELDLMFGSTALFLVKDGLTRLYYYYKELNNGFIQNKNIYQLKSERGLMRKFLIEYMFQYYPNIISDDSLSEEGFNFWYRLINQLKNRIEFGIFHDNQFYEMDNMDELKEFHKSEFEMNQYNYYLKYIA
jgi:hypothetical protein